MGECPHCDAPVKDGDWTCGLCGTPLAGAESTTATDTFAAGTPSAATEPYTGAGETYGTVPAYDTSIGYGGDPSPAAPAAAGGSSNLLKLALVVGALAVVAIVVVWFFALRGPSTSGEEFLGTWTATTQEGISTAVVAKKDETFTVTLGGNEANQKITVPAHLDGTELLITMDDFSTIVGEANAEKFKKTLQALAGDFKMIFSSVDSTHLSLRIVGTTAAGQDFDETIPFVSENTGTS